MTIDSLADRQQRYERAAAARDEGLTLGQIADELGVSRQRVARIIKNGPPREVGRPKGSKKKEKA